MKIVDRKTFLAMPAGTVFMKYEPCIFGDIEMKGNTLPSGPDFWRSSLTDALELWGDGDSPFGRLDEAVASGASLSMDYDSMGRDGLYDEDQLFAVLEKRDVEQLIEKLKEAL